MYTKASMSQESIKETVLLRLHCAFFMAQNTSNLKQVVSSNSEIKQNEEETSSKLICNFEIP